MTVEAEAASSRDRSTDIRIFASASHEPRTRRVSDAVALVVSLLVLAWAAWQSDKTTPFERGLIDFLRSWPPWLVDIFGLLFVIVALYAIGLLIGVAFFAVNGDPEMIFTGQQGTGLG